MNWIKFRLSDREYFRMVYSTKKPPVSWLPRVTAA